MKPHLPQDKTFATGEQLPIHEGAWFIQMGIVKTYTWSEQGNPVILGYWGKGELVGPCLSVVDPYQMQCRTPVVAQPVKPKEVAYFSDSICHHCQQKEQLLLINRCEPLQERLQLFLNWVAYKLGEPVSAGWRINFKLTHQELAEAVRSSRVSVTRALQNLEKQGKIKRSRYGWIVFHVSMSSEQVFSMSAENPTTTILI